MRSLNASRPSLVVPIAALVLASSAGVPVAATFTVTGVVKNEAAQVIAGVDLAFVEYCSDAAVFLPSHTTAANGSFSITVNEATYNIQFTPPAGSVLAGAEIESVAIHANVNLGTIVMHPGIRVAGTVRNTSGTGISGVNLDFVNRATRGKIFAAYDLTGTGGTYSIRVPPAAYDIEFRPAATTTLVTVVRANVIATSDVTGLVDTLPAGVKISGRVRDQASIRIVNADINVYDECAGETIPTAHDNTDTLGNYAVYVPGGGYTLTFSPPRCTAFGAARLASLTVTVDTALGNTDLPNAFPVSGRLLDPSGLPVVDADLKFYDAGTGARQAAVHNHTDAAGNFSVYVPAGSFNVNFLPPSPRDLLVVRVPVTVSGATPLGDLMLPLGVRIAGSVLRPGAVPVRNVNINLVDSVTRAPIRIANDTTAADGIFGIVAPPGTYDLQYVPPVCSLLAPGDQKNVGVVTSLSVPAITLVPGVHARGNVIDPFGFAVDLVDLDFFPGGTRNKTFTPNDNTSAMGAYDVFLSPGLYDIDYIPPAGTSLRPAQRFGVTLGSDTTLPLTTLTQGLVVSGTVIASATGFPVQNAVLAFYPSAGGSELLTAHRNTASDGTYAVAVGAGTWDIRFTPPAGSGLAPRWLRGVVVQADVSLPDTSLLPLTVPTVALFSPASGSTRGGQTITVNGSGFQPDATFELGGVAASGVTWISSTRLTAVTPAHPAGGAGVVVKNPGGTIGVGTGSFTYVEPAAAVAITVTRAGGTVVLAWTATGQGSYTVFRSMSATAWSGTSILGTTVTTSWNDAIGPASPGIVFYNVD